VNFLEICQKVHKIAAIDGDTIVSVENQTGMNARIVDWVQRAYEDIQRHRTDWHFRQALASISVLAGQSTVYNLRDNMEYIDPRSITYTLDGSTKVYRVDILDYDYFYHKYESQERESGNPERMSVNHTNDIVLDPIPDADLTLKFYYTKSLDFLENNTDEPLIRRAYQDSIVWKALKYYAEEQEAEGIFQTAMMNYKEALNRMELDLRPRPTRVITPLA